MHDDKNRGRGKQSTLALKRSETEAWLVRKRRSSHRPGKVFAIATPFGLNRVSRVCTMGAKANVVVNKELDKFASTGSCDWRLTRSAPLLVAVGGRPDYATPSSPEFDV